MFLIVIYCSVIAIASGVGGLLPSLVSMTHSRIQMTLSLVCGVMLGVALLHLLPHSVQTLKGNAPLACILMLCGLLVMLFLIRIFNFHNHDFDDGHIHSDRCHHDHDQQHESSRLVTLGTSSVQAETSQIKHSAPEAAPQTMAPASSNLGWIGLCVGLTIHTLMDGVALAASFRAESGAHWLAGFGTFLAIALHKPLDAISITALMAAQRFSVTRQLIVNLIFSLMVPLGAALFLLLAGLSGEWQEYALGGALAVSAGFFLCISLGDLLPEVHFHSHDRVWLSIMLLLGVAIAVFLEFVIGHPGSGLA